MVAKGMPYSARARAWRRVPGSWVMDCAFGMVGCGEEGPGRWGGWRGALVCRVGFWKRGF